LVPLLLAEGDRDTYRRREAAKAREAEIMKDVKGWEVRLLRGRSLWTWRLIADRRLARVYTRTPS
jgi:hypothetical protein